MAPIRICHCCGSHVRPSPTRRHGRIRRFDAADAPLPGTAVVCADCRAEAVDLVHHWTPRDSHAEACSFCDRTPESSGLVHLESVVDGRVTSRGLYRLCRHCEDVFETFLSDIDASADAHPAATSSP